MEARKRVSHYENWWIFITHFMLNINSTASFKQRELNLWLWISICYWCLFLYNRRNYSTIVIKSSRAIWHWISNSLKWFTQVFFENFQLKTEVTSLSRNKVWCVFGKQPNLESGPREITNLEIAANTGWLRRSFYCGKRSALNKMLSERKISGTQLFHDLTLDIRLTRPEVRRNAQKVP